MPARSGPDKAGQAEDAVPAPEPERPATRPPEGSGADQGAAASRAAAEGADTPQRLLHAAIEAFAERGFHATTTRDIASRAGMSPAALYIHYRTKEELLYQISRVGHQRSVALLSEAAAGPGGPVARLSQAVDRFVRWHAERHTTARVVQYELAALAEEHHAEILQLRRRSAEILRGILAEGVASGDFRVTDLRGTARAMLSLCVDVARWFDPAGQESPAELAALYVQLALRMAGADDSGPGSGAGS